MQHPKKQKVEQRVEEFLKSRRLFQRGPPKMNLFAPQHRHSEQCVLKCSVQYITIVWKPACLRRALHQKRGRDEGGPTPTWNWTLCCLL